METTIKKSVPPSVAASPDRQSGAAQTPTIHSNTPNTPNTLNTPIIHRPRAGNGSGNVAGPVTCNSAAAGQQIEVSKTFNVIQCNLQKCKVTWDTILINFKIDTSTIIMCNEPYVGTDNSIPRVRADLHHFTGTDGQTKPRASITVHKSITNHCIIINELSTRDSIVLKITHEDQTIMYHVEVILHGWHP